MFLCHVRQQRGALGLQECQALINGDLAELGALPRHR